MSPWKWSSGGRAYGLRASGILCRAERRRFLSNRFWPLRHRRVSAVRKPTLGPRARFYQHQPRHLLNLCAPINVFPIFRLSVTCQWVPSRKLNGFLLSSLLRHGILIYLQTTASVRSTQLGSLIPRLPHHLAPRTLAAPEVLEITMRAYGWQGGLAKTRQTGFLPTKTDGLHFASP